MQKNRLLVLTEELTRDLHVNCLTAQQLERLSRLMGECAEVIHVCGKILDHGYHSAHPITKEINKNNLEKELGHLTLWIQQMCNSGDISSTAIMNAEDDKREKVQQYLHYHKIVY